MAESNGAARWADLQQQQSYTSPHNKAGVHTGGGGGGRECPQMSPHQIPFSAAATSSRPECCITIC
jgi:hypothetical protein